MKLQNKLLLILLILALSVCLAFVSSASSYCDLNNVNSTDIVSISSTVYSLAADCDSYSFSSTLGYELSYICFDFYDSSYNVIYTTWGLLTCENWHNYMTTHNITTYDEFKSSIESGLESNYWSDQFSFYYYLSDMSQKFWNLYQDWLATQNIKTYEDGITEGYKQAHQFTSDWLDENEILFEPWGADGSEESLKGLLRDNILNALNLRYNAGYNLGYGTAHDEVYPLAFADGVNASIVRLENWLSGKNILYRSYDKDGDLATINQVMDNNVSQALDERGNADYNEGVTDGQALGKTSMYNELIANINTSFKTEFPLSDGSVYDFTVTNQAYSVAFQAGEAYQINKLTDDGGISDFLADISGIVLSTFFYLGSNISFMGTTALSLISLFVIAVIVIFILKFVVKG